MSTIKEQLLSFIETLNEVEQRYALNLLKKLFGDN